MAPSHNAPTGCPLGDRVRLGWNAGSPACSTTGVNHQIMFNRTLHTPFWELHSQTYVNPVVRSKSHHEDHPCGWVFKDEGYQSTWVTDPSAPCCHPVARTAAGTQPSHASSKQQVTAQVKTGSRLLTGWLLSVPPKGKYDILLVPLVSASHLPTHYCKGGLAIYRLVANPPELRVSVPGEDEEG